jgi:transposase-like protein
MTTFPMADEEASMLKCPTCEHTLERTNRTRLMRLLFGSKRYYCWSCHRDYLYLLGYFIPLH